MLLSISFSLLSFAVGTLLLLMLYFAIASVWLTPREKPSPPKSDPTADGVQTIIAPDPLLPPPIKADPSSQQALTEKYLDKMNGMDLSPLEKKMLLHKLFRSVRFQDDH